MASLPRAVTTDNCLACLMMQTRIVCLSETVHLPCSILREGGWLALARSPGFKEVALEHCPLCHLWVANASGQVKKHITQKHKDIADVVKQVITKCRQDSHF